MQTSYSTNMVEGTAGLIAEAGGAPRVINSLANYTDSAVEIPFGRAVNLTGDGLWCALASASGILAGVAIRDTAKEGNSYLYKDSVGVMSLGRIYVEVEEAVAVGDAVYYRHTGKNQVQTFVLDANLVTGNTLTVTVDGVSLSQAFDTDHLTTITALAVQMVGVPNVASAVVGGASNRTITVTSSDDIEVEIADELISGGASQAGIVITETVVMIPNTDKGLFRNDSDSGTATQTTRARWIKGASIGGLAILEISLP